MAEKKTGFNLADALAGVSKLDTGADGREQIEYIDIDRIDDDPNNFYVLSGLNELAANIELCGLQQPIRVRANPADASRVIIVSGHRRRAAIRRLVNDGRDDLRDIPCIRERTDGSAALQELRLIYANSDTRRMTSAEISKQVERVEALLYQLKEEGYEFPGRMRDHVAEACKVSKTKLARLKMIRDHLGSEWRPYYEKGDLSESTAYTLSQMPDEHQKVIFYGVTGKKTQIRWFYESDAKEYGKRLAAIDKLTCKAGSSKGQPCLNIPGKQHQAVYQSSYSSLKCDKCCDKCEDLRTCKNACPMLAEKIKKLREDAKAQRRQEKEAQEEKNRPIIDSIKMYWSRFGEARSMADKTMKECYKAMGVSYGPLREDEAMALECLEAKYTTSTRLPYGYTCDLSDVQHFIGVADLFGVSLDYLLCRTDDPKGFPASVQADPLAAGWVPLQFVNGMEKPPKSGKYYCRFDCDGAIIKQLAWWDGILGTWSFKDGGTKIDAKCLGWFPLPEDDAE